MKCVYLFCTMLLVSYGLAGCGGESAECQPDCLGRVCGLDPVCGESCGECTGETEYCTEVGLCVDDCAGRVCGLSPVEEFYFGACAGANEV